MRPGLSRGAGGADPPHPHRAPPTPPTPARSARASDEQSPRQRGGFTGNSMPTWNKHERHWPGWPRPQWTLTGLPAPWGLDKNANLGRSSPLVTGVSIDSTSMPLVLHAHIPCCKLMLERRMLCLRPTRLPNFPAQCRVTAPPPPDQRQPHSKLYSSRRVASMATASRATRLVTALPRLCHRVWRMWALRLHGRIIVPHQSDLLVLRIALRRPFVASCMEWLRRRCRTSGPSSPMNSMGGSHHRRCHGRSEW